MQNFVIMSSTETFRSSRPEVFCKKSVLRNFTKFTENTAVKVSFSVKLQAEACIFIKKEPPAQAFCCEFCVTYKNTFFIERLRWLLL